MRVQNFALSCIWLIVRVHVFMATLLLYFNERSQLSDSCFRGLLILFRDTLDRSIRSWVAVSTVTSPHIIWSNLMLATSARKLVIKCRLSLLSMILSTTRNLLNWKFPRVSALLNEINVSLIETIDLGTGASQSPLALNANFEFLLLSFLRTAFPPLEANADYTTAFFVRAKLRRLSVLNILCNSSQKIQYRTFDV